MWRVMTGNNEVYAMKRVALDRVDRDGIASYVNEIALLKRLDGNRRIIKLIDSELKPPSPNAKNVLTLVMELGEIGAFAVCIESSIFVMLTDCRYGKASAGAAAGTDRPCVGVVLLETGMCCRPKP